jgi:hypothetical protein
MGFIGNEDSSKLFKFRPRKWHGLDSTPGSLVLESLFLVTVMLLLINNRLKTYLDKGIFMC